MSTPVPEAQLGGTLSVSKAFHVQEKYRAYDDWTLSIWREYVQNSVDAGATRIDISISSAVPKGYKGADPDARSVTRVVFQDDGGGMSLDVLNDVYFALGATTKGGDDDDSVGGFGRARIMQNFGNVRYSIRSQDLLVEGDGSDFAGYRMRDVPRIMEHWAAIASARAAEMPPGEARDFVEAAAEARRRDAEEMRLDDKFLKGTRFEVDLDPSKGKNGGSKPTVSHMERQLEQYLSQSDLRCQVFVNGVERSRPAKKREARKDIFATLDPQEVLDAWKDNPRVKILDRPDGRKDVAFGKIYVADEAGDTLLVRVSGACMFKRTVWDSPKNLVIELSPVLAREVMTSNRDGLKEPYQRAIDHFQKMMSTDARAALEKREEKQFTVLAGGKGRRVARRPQMDFSADFTATALSSSSDAGPSSETASTTTPAKRTWVEFRKYHFDQFLQEGVGGVPRADFTAFFDAVRRSTSVEGTFLNRWRDAQQADNFLTTLQRNGESAALEAASGEMLAFLCNELRDRRVKADLDESIRHAAKLSGLHDVPIMKENLRPDAERLGEAAAKERRTKLLSAINRADPRGWDPASGKGMKPRKILAMWQVAVDACVDLLMATQPRQKPFPYAAGFYFAHPKWQYQPHTGEDGWSNALAMFTRPDSNDETRFFLLNPLKDEDFTLAFNPSQAADRSDMVSRAMHEVAHVVAPDSHNERFAGALTFMLGKMTPGWVREVNRSMDAAVASVDAIYAGARTRVQPLDDQPGPRPGDILLENLPREVLHTAAIRAPDGTYELDCERIDMLESAFVGSGPGEDVDRPDAMVAPRPGM